MISSAVMRTECLIVAFAVAGAACPACASEFGAIDTARRYSAALMSNDCDAMYGLISPRLIVRDSRPNETRDMICQVTKQLREEGVVETLDAPRASLSDGPRKLVIIPAHREFGRVPDRRVTDLDYLVHSSDRGRTWRVLDLSCVDARWVREIYPAYSGEPPIGPANVRMLEPWKHDR